MSDKTAEASISAYTFQEQVYQQLRQIFSAVAKETEVEFGNSPGVIVDIFARSEIGRFLVFEVKYLAAERKLLLPDYLPIVKLRDTIGTTPSDNPPIVVCVTNAPLDDDIKEVFLSTGMIVINLGVDTFETARNLREALNSLSITLPELNNYSPKTVGVPQSELLAIRLIPTHQFERYIEYQSDLQLAWTIVGIIWGVIFGFAANLAASDLSLLSLFSTRNLIILFILAFLNAIGLLWIYRARKRNRVMIKQLRQGKLSEFTFPISETDT